MNPLFAAAVEVLTFCESHGWRACVIGGLAVQRWGEPRQTRDVDLTIHSGLGREERFVDPFLERFRSRIPDARRFALERRVLLIESDSGVPLDVSLGGLDWADVEGVLVRQGARLDRQLVFDELTPLLELADDTAAGERLRSLFRKHP